MAELGFGIMRFQDLEGRIDYDKVNRSIEEYMRGDYCYFDIHPDYVLGKAQTILRDYVVRKYPRERYIVANKVPYWSIHDHSDYDAVLHASLAACELSYFDNYLLHAVTEEVYRLHEAHGGFDFLARAKEEGKVRRTGFSFHDSPQLLDDILSEHPEIDFVQLQINFYDWNRTPVESGKCYEVAVKHKKPVMVMEPLKGGSLVNTSASDGVCSKSDAVRMCLGFVAALGNVEVILSGMTDDDQVRMNRDFIGRSEVLTASDEQYGALSRAYNEKNSVQCTGCGYCRRECPRNIDIPEIISLVNACGNVGPDDTTSVGRQRIFYRGYIRPERMAGRCVSCRKCEEHCPQKIKIHEVMADAARLFET